jgi:predicted amidohydrolase YtcJ
MRIVLIVTFIIFLSACRSTSEADLIIYNAKIYTVDSTFGTAEAMAVRDGKIIAIGTSPEITQKYFAKEKINAAGSFVYPGFIDAHAHFYRYGLGLQNVDLVGTTSWKEILDKLQEFAKTNPEGWLNGRGWDQTDWEVKDFPDRSELDKLFPGRPVILTRVDGHAAIVNQKAIEIAGLSAQTAIKGGELQQKNGVLTGVLIDNAVDLVSSHIPDATIPEIAKSLGKGQQNCFAVGLTSVVDCGMRHRYPRCYDHGQPAEKR